MKAIRLSSGAHPGGITDGACVMEAVAFVAGERWSDSPECASPVIAEFLRAWNDAMGDEDRQKLIPYIPRLIGTRADAATELKRRYMALDWFCRVSAPTWLRLAGLVAEAEHVEATQPVTDKAAAKAAVDTLASAATAARAARAAAWDAAWVAAGVAAVDAAWVVAGAAAGAAARAAAWVAAGVAAGDAAGDAAGAAAWVAAGDAAWDAARAAARAAAWDALRPTVVALQTSAFELLDRMINCGPGASVPDDWFTVLADSPLGIPVEVS